MILFTHQWCRYSRNRERWLCTLIAALLIAPAEWARLTAEEPGVASEPTSAQRDFWSFRPLSRVAPPLVRHADQTRTPLDQFVLARLEERGQAFAPEADRRMIVRRVYLDLIGLPPSPAQVVQFLNDPTPNAYEVLVDRLLASPHYGERWGRQWLDVVGYADSNGYIRHDSPRPLAYHYRDFVIQSLNTDKPYDQFWREQLAGDELTRRSESKPLSTGDLETLIATHFLRNAPDGTDNTEGNEITRVMERYAVLESLLQITMSAMFGITIDCARCHNHKFDPIPQRDYYALQAVFYPAFNVKNWTQPKDRWFHAAGSAATAAWRVANEKVDREVAALGVEFDDWLLQNRPPGAVLFRDDFSGDSLTTHWRDSARGDNASLGKPAVRPQAGEVAPALLQDGRLSLRTTSPPGSDAGGLVTKRVFEWTPKQAGDWIQTTFDLVDVRGLDGNPATRISYRIARHDDNEDPSGEKLSSKSPGGSLLIDGNPAGGATVHVAQPGKETKQIGILGKSGYSPGHNFGVRITRLGGDQILLEHRVDGRPEPPTQRLKAEHLPAGGFGFEVCCSRSFAIDNVIVEGSSGGKGEAAASGGRGMFEGNLARRQLQLTNSLAAAERQRAVEPERIAWATDLSDQPPVVPLLKRGDYFQHGPPVDPGPLAVLVERDNRMQIEPPASGVKTTGRRLAFAQWATRPGSRAAALLARVQADRLWRGHFGQGLVPTPENFGASGVQPTHPELLEWLASRLVAESWRLKPIHREIVLSRTYRQTSEADDRTIERDPENLHYSRFPAHRLEAELIRDGMLAAAGRLNLKRSGPSVDFVDRGNRQIVLPAPRAPDPHEMDRRSIYIRHRRSQPLTFLQVFDQAVPEPNCTARSTATVVAQSLTLINGEFAVRMGQEFAARLEQEAGPMPEDRIRQAFRVALVREPDASELARCGEFIRKQSALRASANPQEADRSALADFCRMLLATNEFIQKQ